MRELGRGLLGCLFCCGALASQVEVTYTFKDRHEEKKSVTVEPDAKGVLKFSVRRSDLPPDVQSVAVLPEFAIASTGQEGYFVMPNGHLGSFRQREGSARLWASCMPLFGMKTPRMTFVAIVTGMPYNYSLIARAQNGVYRFGPVFDRGLDGSEEDIAIEFHTLSGDDANYAGMAGLPQLSVGPQGLRSAAGADQAEPGAGLRRPLPGGAYPPGLEARAQPCAGANDQERAADEGDGHVRSRG